MRPAAAALTLVTLLAAALPAPRALALTKIEGEYQLMLQLRKDVRAFPWDYDTNDDAISNPFQLRVFSQPRAGVETFVRAEALWRQSDNNGERAEFRFRDAHFGFREEARGVGHDLKFFTRQRRFWVDNHLINFVEDRDATGARLDSWGRWGTNIALIVADRSDQLEPENLIGEYARRARSSGDSRPRDFPREFAPTDSLVAQGALRTDDMYVLRVRREFLKRRRLRAGYTWNRYEGWNGRDSTSDRQEWNAVHGFDTRYRWGDTDIAFEFGVSRRNPGDITHQELAIGRRSTGIRIPDRAVMEAEIRSLKVGSPRTGYINFTPIWWNRAPLYQNSLGAPGNDEAGFEFQTYYLLPERAITLTNIVRRYGKKNESRRLEIQENYNEVYVEFINGFTAKSGYRSYKSSQRVRSGRRVDLLVDEFLSWTNELQVENRLAKLRVQSKFQNIGRPERKQLFVIEPSLNLTDKVKIYNRFALGNDSYQLRKGIFSQVQYRPTGNMEIFLQYGPDNIGGGSNPVEDGNLAGSGDQYDEIKFILKGNF